MPTFDFRCTACEHTFEENIPFGSKDYPTCPQCSNASEKLLTPPLGIVFKGSGFYKTDSGPSVKKAPEKPAEEPKKSEKAEKKEDTTPKSTDSQKS